MTESVNIGCAGWAIPKDSSAAFPGPGSHLQRYAVRFRAVEINSSAYRLHQPGTYARWAASVPDDFRFSVKLPRWITHVERLRECRGLDDFLEGPLGLGDKLGALLIQLPPSLEFDPGVVRRFVNGLRQRFSGFVVCEPRHPSWFEPVPEGMLAEFRIARAAADPVPRPEGGRPGGWSGLVYYRLHGSPSLYRSSYSEERLSSLSCRLRASAGSVPTWCIFNNTAEGAAIVNALHLIRLLGSDSAG